MSLEPGFILNQRYRIIEVIAQGGMGAIYRANDESLGVEVAVKENLFSSEEFARQFRREATILASLRHEHLPRVTDHFVMQDLGQYLVMDFIPGEDLRKRIARTGAIPETQVLKIGVAIAEALSYLHHREPPIIHRDIKPGNIKITDTGQIFLVDFGLAKIAQAGQQTTIGAQSLTPGYAPPEQYGQGTETRSDLYALASTLYSALTGNIPEDGLGRMIGTTTLVPVHTRNPRVSAETGAVIEHGMAIDLDARFQTADEFKDALQNILEGHSTNAALRNARITPPQMLANTHSQADIFASSPAGQAINAGDQTINTPRPAPTAVQVGSLKAKTGRAWSLVFAGLLGVAVLATAGWLLTHGFTPKTTTPTAANQAVHAQVTAAPIAAVQASPSAALPTSQAVGFPTSTSPTIVILPASATSIGPTKITPSIGGGSGLIAFASRRDTSMQVWTMNVDGSDVHQITRLQDGACQPDWSPDGQRLVFISPCKDKSEQHPGSSLFLIDLDGSSLVSLATTPGGDYDPAWAPDGTRIAFTSLREGHPHIYVYNLADNKVARISPAPVYDREPAWSPDSQKIVFTTTREGHEQIWTMNADGSAPQEFSNIDGGLATSPAWSRDGQIIFFSEGSSQPGLVAKRIDDRINEFKIGDAVQPVYNPRISPDGQWILFVGAADGKAGIFRMSSTGTNLTRITDDTYGDIQPSWGP